ncbi:Hypothetical predicted protein [Marmota monax]|uniref:Uncharacterized protein n=1 Tax=Marmota monax TaxID=9995 RepID=A0A5E4AXL5_MARMO|nr:hypothetical protein GHT09_014993 [Marmota monax]VTJ61570.1 Hypothetical predicted protein [Marmota monax]
MNKPILHRKKIVVLNQDPKWRWLGSCQTHRHSAQEVAEDPHAGDSSIVDILDCSEHVQWEKSRGCGGGLSLVPATPQTDPNLQSGDPASGALQGPELLVGA